MNCREPLGARLIARAEEFYDLPRGILCHEKRRNGNISKARWAVMHVLKVEAGWSLPRIGNLLRKDHKAVSYGLKQANILLRGDELFDAMVRQLNEEMAPYVGNPSI